MIKSAAKAIERVGYSLGLRDESRVSKNFDEVVDYLIMAYQYGYRIGAANQKYNSGKKITES